MVDRRLKRAGLVAMGLLLVIGLIAGVLWLNGPAVEVAAAQTPEPTTAQRTISVPGTGTASGAPDIALVQVGVDITNTDVGAAVDEANQSMQDVIDALTGMGINESNIQTTRFDVQQLQNNNPNTGQPTGQAQYEVTNVVQVRVTDTGQISDVIQTALDAGANRVYGLNFSLQNPGDLESEARTQAVEDAQTRAEELADALGVTLGDLVSITEQGGGGGVSPLVQEAAVGGSVPIQQGQLSVSVQVNTVWAIEP